MENVKLKQIKPKSNGFLLPSVIEISAKDYSRSGNILSSTNFGEFEILNPSALAETDESIPAEIVYPGFMRMQALEDYYLPSWPIPEQLDEFSTNLEVNICSSQSCIIEDQCLSDSFVIVQKLAEQFNVLILYFDFTLEYLYWQDRIKLGKSLDISPFNRFIKLLNGCKPSICILDSLEVFRDDLKDYDQISIKDFAYHVMKILKTVDGVALETSMIAIFSDVKALNPVFLSCFSRKLYLKAPNTIERNNYVVALGKAETDIAKNSVGISYSDIYRSIKSVPVEADLSDKLQNLNLEQGIHNLDRFRNTYFSSNVIPKTISLNPLYGYKELKEKLGRLIILPLSHPNSFLRLGKNNI
jgi:hypothetical protein